MRRKKERENNGRRKGAAPASQAPGASRPAPAAPRAAPTGAVQLSNVDQGGNGLLRGGGAPHDVQPAGQQAGLNLHELAVHAAHDGVPLIDGQRLDLVVLGGQGHVL